MRHFQRVVLMLVSLAAFAAVLPLVPHRSVVAATPTPVDVTNTPLPVKGTVTAVISGTPSVDIASSVPLSVTDTDDPDLSLVLFSFSSSTTLPPYTFAVPAGKGFVIEEFSMNCIESPSALIPTDYRLGVISGGTAAQYTFAPTLLVGKVSDELISTETTRIYADPGTDVSAGTGSTVPAGANCNVAIAGHLVH